MAQLMALAAVVAPAAALVTAAAEAVEMPTTDVTPLAASAVARGAAVPAVATAVAAAPTAIPTFLAMSTAASSGLSLREASRLSDLGMRTRKPEAC